jgi:FMN phosphatase YigB (HAD superfamily)
VTGLGEATFDLAVRRPTVARFVDDHPVNDIQGAREAGMRTIWLTRFHGWPSDGVSTTTIAPLSELAPLLAFTDA